MLLNYHHLVRMQEREKATTTKYCTRTRNNLRGFLPEPIGRGDSGDCGAVNFHLLATAVMNNEGQLYLPTYLYIIVITYLHLHCTW